MTVDARGLSCPEPVMLTMEALNNGGSATVLVSEAIAKNNVEKCAKSFKKNFNTTDKGDYFEIVIE